MCSSHVLLALSTCAGGKGHSCCAPGSLYRQVSESLRLLFALGCFEGHWLVHSNIEQSHQRCRNRSKRRADTVNTYLSVMDEAS